MKSRFATTSSGSSRFAASSSSGSNYLTTPGKNKKSSRGGGGRGGWLSRLFNVLPWLLASILAGDILKAVTNKKKQDDTSNNSIDEKKTQQQLVRAPAVQQQQQQQQGNEKTSPTVSWPSSKLSLDRLPNQCAEPQMAELASQLPYTRSCRQYWHNGCSIRAATTGGAKRCGSNDPILARQFFANVKYDDKQPFTAISFGFGSNDAVSTVKDLIHVGSGLSAKYAPPASTGTTDCPISLENKPDGAAPSTPNIVAIDFGMDYGYASSETLKKIVKQKSVVSDRKKDDMFQQIGAAVKNELPSSPVIHYVNVPETTALQTNQPGSGLSDYGLLVDWMHETANLLQFVRFVTFTYNHRGDWADKSLVKLIAKFRSVGLVCYWTGTAEESDHGLWRITGCFQDWYETHKRYSKIQCVSFAHDDVKELATSMEEKFLATLKRKQSFGE